MHPAGFVLLILAALALILLIRSEWEKKHLKTEYYTIKSSKIRIGTRFIFISDMHSMEFGEDNEDLISEIRSLEPDCILIGGDMMTCGKIHEEPPRTSACIHLCEELSEHYPVFYAEGNHEVRFRRRFPEDFQIFMEHLKQNSALEYLSNDMEPFEKEAELIDERDEFRIYGISLPEDYYAPQKPGFGNRKEMPEGFIRDSLGHTMRSENGSREDSLPSKDRFLDGSYFNILLLHSPLYLKEASASGADLVLSGHFHGGTIRLPILGGLMTPQLQFFVRECAGEFSEGSTRMIVNRGLGTHSVRIRLNDRPEISVIDVIPKGDSIAEPERD